jgi:hypothetical protein
MQLLHQTSQPFFEDLSMGVQALSLRSQGLDQTRVERHDRSRLLSQSRKLHASFLTHPAHAIVASEAAVFAFSHDRFSFSDIVAVLECSVPCEMMVTRSPRDQRYAMTMVFAGEVESMGQRHTLTLLTQLADPPQAETEESWNMRVTAAFQPGHASGMWSGYCPHYPICVCAKPADGSQSVAADALSLAVKLASFGGVNERRAVSYANRLASAATGGYHDAVFPAAATCVWDLAPQKVIAATNPVTFSCLAGRDPVEVSDIPVLCCSRCGEQTFDLTQLARIEGLLHVRSEVEYQSSYRFHQLQRHLA